MDTSSVTTSWVGPTPHFTCISQTRKSRKGVVVMSSLSSSTLSYQHFIDFAFQQIQLHTCFIPSPLQEKFNCIQAIDGKSELKFDSLQSSKIRLFRNMYINGHDSMQVLDLCVFPKVEFDLPLFCANFFTTPSMSIIVLDLNPLHDVIASREYKEKYFKNLMPLGIKYAELLPWGGKITGESLRFFSPIVIWTRFPPSPQKHDILFAAFVDYYKAWLDLMEQAVEETDASQIMRNCEAQHRYLTWRAEKDPGHQLLKRLVGEARARDVLRSFLFNGVDELGSKTFLDYFPEYKLADGTINQKRSVLGKSFEGRPWDINGEFIGSLL